MKNLYIQDFGDIGGATNSLKELVTKLYKNYGVVPIIVTSDKNSVNKFADENGFENYAINHKQFIMAPSRNIFKKIIEKYFSKLLYLYNYILNNIALHKLEKHVDFNEIDIVHTNVMRSQIGFIINKKYGIKHVVHLREFGDLDYNCKPLMKNYIKYVNRYSTCFIAISNVIKEHWVKKGIDKDKINVIYNGVDSDKFNKNCRKTSNDKIKFIMSGFIFEGKGQLELIKALKLLPSEYIRNITLDLYGGVDEDYYKKINYEIKNSFLMGRVHLKKYTNKLNELLPEYDVGVICSKAEGFGRVTIEYMMCGLCVIASDSGANIELIKNNYNGLIYKLGNINDLAKKIMLVIENKEKRLKLANSGYFYSKNNFNSEKNSNNVYKLYERLMTKEEKNEENRCSCSNI